MCSIQAIAVIAMLCITTSSWAAEEPSKRGVFKGDAAGLLTLTGRGAQLSHRERVYAVSPGTVNTIAAFGHGTFGPLHSFPVYGGGHGVAIGNEPGTSHVLIIGGGGNDAGFVPIAGGQFGHAGGVHYDAALGNGGHAVSNSLISQSTDDQKSPFGGGVSGGHGSFGGSFGSAFKDVSPASGLSVLHASYGQGKQGSAGAEAPVSGFVGGGNGKGGYGSGYEGSASHDASFGYNGAVERGQSGSKVSAGGNGGSTFGDAASHGGNSYGSSFSSSYSGNFGSGHSAAPGLGQGGYVGTGQSVVPAAEYSAADHGAGGGFIGGHGNAGGSGHESTFVGGYGSVGGGSGHGDSFGDGHSSSAGSSHGFGSGHDNSYGSYHGSSFNAVNEGSGHVSGSSPVGGSYADSGSQGSSLGGGHNPGFDSGHSYSASGSHVGGGYENFGAGHGGAFGSQDSSFGSGHYGGSLGHGAGSSHGPIGGVSHDSGYNFGGLGGGYAGLVSGYKNPGVAVSSVKINGLGGFRSSGSSGFSHDSGSELDSASGGYKGISTSQEGASAAHEGGYDNFGADGKASGGLGSYRGDDYKSVVFDTAPHSSQGNTKSYGSLSASSNRGAGSGSGLSYGKSYGRAAGGGLGNIRKAMSYQSVHIENFHPVPVYGKKESDKH